MNFFETFGLNISYQIDLVQLEKSYLALQKRYHPDNFSEKIEIMKATSCIIDVNNAYGILKNDIKRALYMLELYNIYLDGDKKNYTPDKSLMIEIFNFQESGSVRTHDEISKIKDDMQSAFSSGSIDIFADLTMRLVYSKVDE